MISIALNSEINLKLLSLTIKSANRTRMVLDYEWTETTKMFIQFEAVILKALLSVCQKCVLFFAGLFFF